MKRQDILNILFTFVVGVVVGVYVFFAGFAPTTQKIETVVKDIGQSLVITGEAYGGCDRANTCPSFNIANNGTYRYAYFLRNVEQQVLREGSVPLALQQKLKRYATRDALQALSDPLDPIMCESYTDGIDVRYTVELENEQYVLDSCGTTVDPDTMLWQTLSEMWNYFQTTG
jgi:hypothetical protein